MKAALEDFSQELEALEKHIASQTSTLKTVSSLQKDDSLKHLVEDIEINMVANKIFNYNSYVISLYGIFERYIEDLLKGYLVSISSVFNTYNELPNKIREANIKKCSELLLNLGLQKNKDLAPEIIISALYNNVSNGSIKLNYEAFIQHSSNFRSSSINEYFKSVDINDLNKLVCNYEPIKSTLESKFDNPEGTSSKQLFKAIDEIADRRNEVAHGTKVLNLLTPELILEYCVFFQSYSESLYHCLTDRVLNQKVNVKSTPIKPISVFNNSILCCDASDIELTSASKIIVERKSVYPNFITVNIEGMQVNNDAVKSVKLEDKVDVGIKVDAHITNSNNFYLLA
ncbi:hypothetical protein H5119_15380 [Pseudoalteromonas sp. SG45-5]|uniref:MAE_28990/MAE_18760 family HEPN-like nuclease n=1 Tax=unclassified Pseudoalteromonas TaxID=194690 RepID=UPI0015F8427A|nr:MULTISPECIES: MAE_28990/MAE_18760 family HEPN-like nuclease [unclassified Pseudoalteromonas]MBB1386903.1 hypothetical protein [Pseudoalteromonas sp. SG45-5]MBB1395044.1 hypothetical protein [Pseudoalteromonas sp. SG44-4]MBB1448961.1 hypothetical protein [Pseudoalteromonas sp. SG41-6]